MIQGCQFEQRPPFSRGFSVVPNRSEPPSSRVGENRFQSTLRPDGGGNAVAEAPDSGPGQVSIHPPPRGRREPTITASPRRPARFNPPSAPRAKGTIRQRRRRHVQFVSIHPPPRGRREP